MKLLEDYSRDELLKFAKDARAVAMNQSNHPPVSNCPFCYGTTVTPTLKGQVRKHLIEEWHKDVTSEEYEAWWEKYTAELRSDK